MKTMHLFAGAGGGLLADLIIGHHPIVAVENNPYCSSILRERARDGWFPGLRVHEGDVRLFDASDYAGQVDCIAAGFPCQDISSAGKGAGITGERSGLVSEVFRAVDAIRPRFVFLENSPRIRTRGRHVVIGELVARGYAWRDGIIGAADVGAPHRRDRWFCLAANADGMRELQSQGRQQDQRGWIDYPVEDVACVMRQGCPDGSRESATETIPYIGAPSSMASGEGFGTPAKTWFEIEPDVGHLVHGLADDVVPAAIKAIGNGQVPLQAAAAWIMLSRSLNRQIRCVMTPANRA